MKSRAFKRMRIGKMSSPVGVGPVHATYTFTFELELDPGAPLRTEPGLATVVISHMDLLRLRLHPPEENAQRAAALARHFAEQKLVEHFSAPEAPRQVTLRVGDAEVYELAQVDPDRVDVDPGRWIELPDVPVRGQRPGFR